MHIRDVFVTLSREQEISAEREKEMWGIAERMKEKKWTDTEGVKWFRICLCVHMLFSESWCDLDSIKSRGHLCLGSHFQGV